MSMEKKHLKHLEVLEKLAFANPVDGGARIKAAGKRIVACLIVSNKVVAFGMNQTKTHPFASKFKKNDESLNLHAETDCIKNALKNHSPEDLEKATLYICRIRRTGEWGFAKPCKGCMKAIATFNIKNVVYSTDSTGKYEIL